MNNSVSDYMATELVSFTPDEDIIHAMRILLGRHLSGAPVLDDAGNLVGILSQKDCLAVAYHTAYHQDWAGSVEKYMSREVEHIEADINILDAVEKFQHSSYRRFPVLRNGQLIGQISRHDIMRAIDELYLQKP